MPGFGQGLTTGILNGWNQQQQRKDELARNQRQQDISNYLAMAQADNLPDDKRQWALDQAAQLMQGKKPGQGKGNAPNGITQRLARMLGMAHGNGQQQGQQLPQQGGQPMSEAIPGGQGTSAAPTLPTGQNPQTGRPSITQGDQAQPQTQAPVEPSYEDQLKSRVAAAQKSGNQFALRRAQDALDKYQTAKESSEAKAASAEEIANIRANSVREVADLKAQQAEELQKLRDSDSKDRAKAIEDLKAQNAKDLEDLRAKHKKELEDIEAKARKDLKQTPGAGSPREAAQSASESSNPETLRTSVLYEIMTGQRPAFGLGKSAQRDAYNEERAKVIEELGPQAEQLKAAYKAGNSGLTRAITQRVQIGAFENTFQKAIDQAEDASSNVPRSDARLFNSWQQLAQANLTNNPELARFKVAAQTAINEYSRIVSSATGGGVSTDTARREAENILNTAMSKGSFSAALEQMKKEADFRTQGLDQEINRMVGQLGQSPSGPGRGGTPTPPPPDVNPNVQSILQQHGLQ